MTVRLRRLRPNATAGGQPRRTGTTSKHKSCRTLELEALLNKAHHGSQQPGAMAGGVPKNRHRRDGQRSPLRGPSLTSGSACSWSALISRLALNARQIVLARC